MIVLAILYIAVALSLDAFSVALSIGLTNKDNKKHLLFSSLVGILHFFMPLLGTITNKVFLNRIVVSGNKLLGFILLILAIQMLLEIKDNKEVIIKMSYSLLALTVSIDSYFTGIGLMSFEGFKIMSFLIFSITSFSFSIVGCKLGVIGKTKYSKLSQYLAIIILLALSVKYILL